MIKIQNKPKNTLESLEHCFDHSNFCNLNLFRISCFEFRIFGFCELGGDVKRHIIKITFVLLLCLICPWSASAEVEWELQQTINMEKKPIDMVVSARGTYLFVLTDDGIVHVYDSDGSYKGEIRCREKISTIIACGRGRKHSHPEKQKEINEIQKIDIEFVEEINIEGFPYKGNADAPVVIAVFTDYQ